VSNVRVAALGTKRKKATATLVRFDGFRVV
jgi:hypothetical protein